MSIGSISPGLVSPDTAARTADARTRPEGAGAAEKAEQRTIADHVAAADEQEPIRSASATLGTLVDTYL